MVYGFIPANKIINFFHILSGPLKFYCKPPVNYFFSNQQKAIFETDLMVNLQLYTLWKRILLFFN
jgi:hypothetical protein